MPKPKEHKFTWGETIIIKKNAPIHMHPGEIASICSVIKSPPRNLANKALSSTSTWLYTVEFGDGSSIDLPESYLEPFSED